jgi:hypothetical protein
MEFNFDIRGNLKPYEVIEISSKEFQNTFVNSFDENSSRGQLFANYQFYMEELSKIVSKDFYQLIDGSFITNKTNPKDIDFITVLDYQDYESNKDFLEKEFASYAGRKKYNVDAYIVANYPENHKKHIFSKSDLLYWRNLFSKTRVSRDKKQYEKGIIQIKFNKNE